MASVSVNGFILVMEEFIEKLKLAFPGRLRVLSNSKLVLNFSAIQPRKLVELYFAGLSPYIDKIKNKDESFILEDISKIEVLKHIKIDSLWGSASPVTKKSVWEYLCIFTKWQFKFAPVQETRLVI